MLAASAPRELSTDVRNVATDERGEDAGEPRLKMGVIENVRKLWDSVRMTVFVVGTALTVFVAARNTITWYVSHVCLMIRLCILLVFGNLRSELSLQTLKIVFCTIVAFLCDLGTVYKCLDLFDDSSDLQNVRHVLFCKSHIYNYFCCCHCYCDIFV